MCGICGIINLDGSSAENHTETVMRMCQSMRLRGPDDEAVETVGGACFGQRRLSIIDTSRQGRQPFLDEERNVCLTANGEIYNFISYRANLEKAGCTFQSRSDSEVILHGYKVDGLNVSNKLRGMFAFAIHDRDRRLTMLARDRQGIKPLYYFISHNYLIFASDLRAILSSRLVEAKLNPATLDQYLIFGVVPEPDTMIRGIKMLPPGHRLLLENRKVTIERYWEWPFPSEKTFNATSALRDVRELLEDSICVHLQSDVPLGVFLSGGIDSTVVAALAARNSPLPLKTFSIGFEDGKKHLDERSTARKTANFLQTDHHEVLLTGREVESEFEEIISNMPQPSFDGINTFFISKITREADIKVALSGLGGDELFGGYGTYQFLPKWGMLAKWWGRLPDVIKKCLLGTLRGCVSNPFRKQKISRLEKVSNFKELYAMIRANGWSGEENELYSRQFCKKFQTCGDFEKSLSCLYEITDQENCWRMTQKLEMRNYMGWRLLRDTDAMSMAHSLEVRVPLIDDNLIHYVMSLPDGWHKVIGWPKRLLVESMIDIIPDFVVNRPKQGFQLPMDVWMKGILKPVVDSVFDRNSIKERGIFDESKLCKLYRAFQDREVPYEYIWKFVVLESWMKHNGLIL